MKYGTEELVAFINRMVVGGATFLPGDSERFPATIERLANADRLAEAVRAYRESPILGEEDPAVLWRMVCKALADYEEA